MKRTPSIVATALIGCIAAACSTLLGFEDLVQDDTVPGSDAGDATHETGTESGKPDGEADSPDADSSDTIDDTPLETTGDVVETGPDDANPDGQDATSEQPDCGDLQKDPENCGACNHSCLGGDCVDGMCQPIVLAFLTGGAWGLALNDTTLCVSIQLHHELHCMSNSIKNTTFWSVSFGLLSYPSSIVLDDTHIYWTNRSISNGSIGKCEIANCSPNKLIDQAKEPLGLVIEGNTIYWTEMNEGTVKKAFTDGTGITTLVTLGRPSHLTMHGDYLYFSERADNKVVRATKSDESIEILASSSSPMSIAVTDTWVYWTNHDQNGIVFRVPNESPPNGGHQPQTFAEMQNRPFGIVADENHVYWIARGASNVASGALRTCPASGCPGNQPITLDEGLNYPVNVVMDEKALYYSIYGIDTELVGEVRKIAKPSY